MTKRHSTRRAATAKPDKPSDDFPLFAHASGKWAIKRRGKLFYFGRWANPTAALREYQRHKADIDNGIDPRKESPAGGGITVRELCNRFLTHKEQQLKSGELSQRSFDDYRHTCLRIANHFGRDKVVESIGPTEFMALRRDVAKTRSPIGVGNEVTRVRTTFKFAHSYQYVEKPVNFGPDFVRPNRKMIRLHKQKKEQRNGKLVFEASDILALLDEAGVHLYAMVLLGINCGFGNSDCGNLSCNAIDLDTGWVDFPRPKTAIERRCPLWPETIQALRDSEARRPEPATSNLKHLFFLTSAGLSWAKEDSTNPLSQRTTAALQRLDIHRTGVGFYSLRHTFATVGSQLGDETAVRIIMGHADHTVLDNYRHSVDDKRLKAVTKHVRKWLFGSRKPK